MTNSDKSYLEIRVTFQHILILLAGVIVIGSFLFYLGYQAGQNNDVKKADLQAAAKEQRPELPLDKTIKKDDAAQDTDKIENDASSITEEMNLHRRSQEPEPSGPTEGALSDGNSEPGADTDASSNPPKTDKIPAKPAAATDIHPKPETTPARETRKESQFAIQVGAFHSYQLAKQYSVKFSKAGYPISISQGVVNGKTWFRVKVGGYSTRNEAKKEKQKLERLENKKFTITESD